LENADWPDLDAPLMPPIQRPYSAEPPRSRFSPSDAFAVSAVIQIGRRMPVPQRTLLLAATAVVLLGLILGATLFTVRALTGRPHASGRSVVSTVPNSPSSIPSATASRTAAATATATSTSVGTGPVGNPTSTSTSAPRLVTIFSDPLTSNAKGWIDSDGCTFQSNGLLVTGMGQCIAPVTAADTVNISVRMQTVAQTMGAAGIGFRVSKDDTSQQYAFYLTSNGTCVAEDLVTHTYFFNKSCSSAHQGANAVNTLLINQSGAHMDFYVNGTLAGSANDATLSTGEVALEGQKGRQSMIFTNFTLTSWQ
jgi:hypothetical protein